MVNINVGILGHVDSGKTSLAKALSRVASTAAFDKNPQSQERGITLDLGFSAFFVPVPAAAAAVAEPTAAEQNANIVNSNSNINKHREMVRRSFGVDPFDASKELTLQFTLVDCPGHASLIRAVMGAAHIIDLMILVIDITKGIQAQTAECIVLGEMLGRKLVVVLNKVDLVPGATEQEKRSNIEKKKKQLRAVFSKTRWPNAPFVEAAANPGSVVGAPAAVPNHTNNSSNDGNDDDNNASSFAANAIGIEDIKNTLATCAARMAANGTLMSMQQQQQSSSVATKKPTKLDPAQFFMMVDHCFAVKGHGTVLTGTIVGGTVAVGDEVRIPDLGLTRRVKSIQVFRKPVEVAHCGDRIGLCVTQVNAERLERGIACSALPNSPVLTIQHACVMAVAKVRFHKAEIEASSMQFHVTIGHVTAMATMRFFSKKRSEVASASNNNINAAAAASSASSATAVVPTHDPFGISLSASSSSTTCLFDFNAEYEYEERLTDAAVLQLAPPDSSSSNPEDAVAHVAGERIYYAVLLLDRPVTAVVGSMVIASHLDGIAEKASCRLAMHGVLLSGEIGACLPGASKDDKEAWRQMKVVRYRERGVNIDKILDARTCIARPTRIPASQIQQQQQQQATNAAAAAARNPKAAAAGATASPATGTASSSTTAATPAQQQPPQVVIDLTKFVSFPVVFRKKIRPPKPPAAEGTDQQKAKNNNDDDDEEHQQQQAGGDEQAGGKKAPRVPRAPLPTMDIPGRIESTFGSNGKVRIIFNGDAFDGNRAYGSILILDKKYPFSTTFKVESDAPKNAPPPGVLGVVAAAPTAAVAK